MVKGVKYSQNQLRDYASLFSRQDAIAWMEHDCSSILSKIKRYDWDNPQLQKRQITYLDYLQLVYKILKNNYQTEYIYKNEFLNQWLIKELGVEKSKLFSEFRLGNNIADLVMFNGVSKVFEIKTEYDTYFRLDKQIESYKKIFNHIYLIIPQSKLEYVKHLDDEVGLITFDNKREERFVIERKGLKIDRLDPESLMYVLHTDEYRNIIYSYFGKLPDMTSFNQFNICKDLIQKIPISILNELFIKQLKNRGEKNILSDKIFKEFNQISLALKLGKEERKQMFDVLKTPILI